MYAVITACITLSINWGGDLMGSIVCLQLDLDGSNMQNYKTALYYKLFTFVLALMFIPMLPSNDEIKQLGLRVNPVKELEEYGEDDTSICDIQNLLQDFDNDF